MESLAVRYEVMMPASTKMVYDDKRGKIRWISQSEVGFATAAGNIKKEDWRQQVWKIIQENGLEELLEQIEEHCRRHCAWLKQEPELELYAMDCLASKAYESWTEFGRE